MESRYTRRYRYGEDLGSVKSRIQARETTKTSEDPSSKIKQARLRSDERAFRNAEGVRSRMFRFAQTASSSTTNGSSSSVGKTPQKNGSVNGDVRTKTEQRIARDKTAAAERSASSSDTKPLSKHNRRTKNEAKEEKVEAETPEVDRKPNSADVVAVTNGAAEQKPLDDVSITKGDDEASKSAKQEKEKDVKLAEESAKDQKNAASSFISSFTSSKPRAAINDTSDDVKSSSGFEPSAKTRGQRVNGEKTDKELRLGYSSGDSLDDNVARRRNRRTKDFGRSSTNSSSVSTPDQEAAPALTSGFPDSAKDVPSDSPANAASASVPTEEAQKNNSPEAGDMSHETEDALSDDEVQTDAALPSNDKPLDITSEPENKPDSAEPDVIEPDVTELDITEPEITEPDVTESDVTKPAVTEPEVTEPPQQNKKTEENDESKENRLNVTNDEKKEDELAHEPQSGEVKYTMDNIEECKDLDVLDKMLTATHEYEDRRKIRAVMRALRRGGATLTKSTPTTTSKWQSRTTRTEVSVNTPRNTSRTTTTTTEIKETRVRKTQPSPLPRSGDKENKTPPDPKSLAEKYGLSHETKREKPGTKKVGSIFDREEETPKKSGSRLDLERRQAERKREMMRSRGVTTSATSKDARKKFVEKLEVDGGANSNGGVKTSKSPTAVVPNANNVKNMLLRWCKAKTRGYEHVDITNYSSSWSDGMAFCALTHNFFPDAFDYSSLDPNDRAHNFNLAFDTAEKRGDIPILLDVDDLVRMSEPDWKCIYTYITEFYKHIRELGMT